MSRTPPSMMSAPFVEIDLRGRVSYGRAHFTTNAIVHGAGIGRWT